jgi:hypothetical protein
MGHASHDPETFAPHPIGARARLVEGRTMILDRDGREVPVPKTAARRVWRVQSIHDSDVTGMPMYLLESRDRFQLARHEAIEIDREMPTPAALRRKRRSR